MSPRLLLVVTVVGLLSARFAVAFGILRVTAQENMVLSKQFPCKEPRPRAIPVSNLKNMVTQSRMILPSFVVLDRCDSGAGCCLDSNKYRCAPADNGKVPVKLEFFVMEQLINGRYHKRIEHVIEEQHTKCECKLITDNDLIK